jgi:hypothetical protein
MREAASPANPRRRECGYGTHGNKGRTTVFSRKAAATTHECIWVARKMAHDAASARKNVDATGFQRCPSDATLHVKNIMSERKRGRFPLCGDRKFRLVPAEASPALLFHNRLGHFSASTFTRSTPSESEKRKASDVRGLLVQGGAAHPSAASSESAREQSAIAVLG